VDSFLVDVEVVSLIDWLQVEVLASGGEQSVLFELTVMLHSFRAGAKVEAVHADAWGGTILGAAHFGF
jgi:hypothetical protein